MASIAKTFWGALIACVLLSAGSAAQRPAQAVKTADSASDESIQQQTQVSQGTILYFPDYVVGGGWSVQLVLGNLDPDHSARVDVETYDQQGQRVSRFFNSGTQFNLPAQGSRILRSGGGTGIQRGWIKVEADTASVRGLLVYRHGDTGIEVSVAPIDPRDQFALFVEESSAIGTGLAIFKPDASPEIEFQIRDETGSDPLGPGLTIGGFLQQARTLPEWFDKMGVTFRGDFQGLLFLRSGDASSFAPLGLRFGKQKTSLSAVPVIPFVEDAGAPPNPFQPGQPDAASLYFPDYVDGAGWSVQLVLGNLDPVRRVTVDVEVYDQQGQPVRGLFVSGTRFELPAQGSRVLRSGGGTGIRRGWIHVDPDNASVRGLLVYRHAETGIEVGVAPIDPSDQFALFVEETSEIGTGLALFKPEAAPEIELRIRNEAGRDPVGQVLTFGNFQQQALTLPEWFQEVGTTFLKDFRGMLFLRSKDGSSFAPLGLRFGKRQGSLSAVPVIPILDESGDNQPPTVTLSASPAAIEPGGSATLTWTSTNAESATIRPGIGAVPTSGSRTVSPAATTTYRITVTDASGRTASASATVTVTATPDLVVDPPSVSASTLTPGQSFDLRATVRNQGGSRSGSTTLRYYRSSDTTITTSDTSVGTDAVGALDASLTSAESIQLTAPSSAGTYYYGACVDPVSGETATGNNCSMGVRVTVGTPPADLVVDSPSVSASTLTPGQSFDLRATVRNQGGSRSGSTILRYYRSSDATITTSDTSVGTDAVSALDASLTSAESIQLTAPSSAGTYYYGACVDPVSGETATGNNCSMGVRVTVGAPADLVVDSPSVSASTLTPGQSFDLRATVRNQGGSRSGSTILRYYRSSDATITTSDTSVGTDAVSALDASLTSAESIQLTAPSSAGTYYYGACVDPVSGETATGNNCSAEVRVTVVGLPTVRLSASPASIERGRSATLTWSSTNAVNATITPGIGSVPVSGSRTVSPTSTTTYQITVQNAVGQAATAAATVTVTAPVDRAVLEAFYKSTGGPNWTNRKNWLTDAPLDQWHGVTVNNAGRVTVLDLSQNNLSGAIPSQIGRLDSLLSLDLYQNALTGSIPPELGNLRNLRNLNIWGNGVSGSIPPELGNLSSHFWQLCLAGNNLSGSVPPELGKLTGLVNLCLNSNLLEGSIPSSFLRLNRLSGFWFNDNKSLCLPRQTEFIDWFEGISDRSGPHCARVYWVDGNRVGKIKRFALGGHRIETLVTGLNAPRGLALDPGAGKMYWTEISVVNAGDLIRGKIRRANLDGSGVEALVTGLGNPHHLALDIGAGKIYWTDSNHHKIQRANLNGNGMEDVVTLTGSGSNNVNNQLGLTLDIGGKKIYWTQRGSDYLWHANLDGSNVRYSLHSGMARRPEGLALGGGYLYLAAQRRIQRIKLGEAGADDVVTANDVGDYLALDIDAKKIYWTTETGVRWANADDGTEEWGVRQSGSSPKGVAIEPGR